MNDARAIGAFAPALIGLLGNVACGGQPSPPPDTAGPSSVAVYALSRGAGVPQGASRVLAEARRLFDEERARKRVLRISSEHIGIEGEMRICAEFVDAGAARAAYARLVALARGTELTNVVMESCPDGSKTQGERQ